MEEEHRVEKDQSDGLSVSMPTLREATWTWARVAASSFGGPAGQIAVMFRYVVEERGWVSERRFLHALNYTMLLPGPEAQQLSVYLGWLLNGTRGGLIAGWLFVLPGFLSILALSILYVTYRELTVVTGLLFGLKAAVLVIVFAAVLSLSRQVFENRAMVLLAVAAFIGMYVFNVSFPIIVIGAGLIGFLGYRLAPDTFTVMTGHDADATTAVISDAPADGRPSRRQALGTLTTWLVVWFGPLLVLGALLGRSNVLVQEGLFFSLVAAVSFGGAYAALAYVAQEAVLTYEWLLPGEMLDGLGFAGTTPGPLIQVVQFVGFMGAYRNPGTLDPLVAGIAGSVVVTWVTFVPSFLWIFVGAPYIEYLRGRTSITAALSAVTAAVVGVIVNLGLWFAVQTLFNSTILVDSYGMQLLLPIVPSVNLPAFGIAGLAGVLHLRFNQSVLRTIGVGIVAGIVYELLVAL
ncbi:chromate efflux transporter [Natronomonas sp. EA1]|uniref:chromate efflux transporter n=1 Tax=Natronomonas sp. EA1 TaxID=3421655 RepID=UPI003EB7DF37